MKKIVIGVLTASFIFGAGSYAFAVSNNNEQEVHSFGKMKHMIQKMHPNLSLKEQKEMYNKCVDEGMMENHSSEHMAAKS
jgi:hypothetical protein